jgi:hypothetical protein
MGNLKNTPKGVVFSPFKAIKNLYLLDISGKSRNNLNLDLQKRVEVAIRRKSCH